MSDDFLPSRLKANLLLPDLTEDQLLRNIRQLSLNFTKIRQDIGVYLNSPEMVSAYTWFYLPTNIFKLQFFLSQLSEPQRSLLEDCQLLDMGTGPGTFALSWARFFPNGGRINGVDHSAVMLQQARKIAAGLGLENRVSFTSTPEGLEANLPTVLLMGNVLNENNQKWFWSVLSKAKPKFLLLIEPGTSEQFKNILPIRQELLNQGWLNLYPCPSSQACPLASSSDWCHQVVYPKLDEEVHRLCQMAQIDRRTLPAIIHFYFNQQDYGPLPNAYARSERSDGHFSGRTLQYLGSNKHSLEYKVCREVDQSNQIETWEIQKKNLTKETTKKLESAGIGQKLEAGEDKKLGNKKLRVRLPNQ